MKHLGHIGGDTVMLIGDEHCAIGLHFLKAGTEVIGDDL